jgi:hypothetical protein
MEQAWEQVEVDSRGGFGVFHRVSDAQCEQAPNDEDVTACEAQSRH